MTRAMMRRRKKNPKKRSRNLLQLRNPRKLPKKKSLLRMTRAMMRRRKKNPKKAEAKPAAKKEESSFDEDSSDDEDDEPAKPKEAVKRKAEPAAVEEDDDEPIVKKSAADFANKSFDSPRAQKGGHNKSFGQLEGKKIFVHNVSEEAVYEDFQASVEKFGECTDFFNPGRGFAFIEFSSNEEAAACIAGMDNTEVAGRTIQMNIAKPKGEKTPERGGQGRGGQGGRGGQNKSFNGQP